MGRRHADRGLSGSVQLAVLLPFALGIFLLLLQWSLVTWAEATALAAAQEAARTAGLSATSAAAVGTWSGFKLTARSRGR